MGIFDDCGHILTPEEILKLAETPAGKKQIGTYIMRARVAYATQSLFERLNIVPDAKTQQECCETLYEVLFRVDLDYVMAWVDDLRKFKDENPEQFDNLPLC